MIFCSKCGKENADGAAFCHSCGEELAKKQNTESNPKSASQVNAQQANQGKQKSSKKKGCVTGCLVVVGAFIAISVILALFDDTSTGQAESGGNQTKTGVIQAKFERVGYFKSDGMRGFTYFVENPNKKDIKDFCEKTRQAHYDRILKIHFFDLRSQTPDVTLKYEFPKSSDDYLIADYLGNPHTKKVQLKFHKDIDSTATRKN